MADVCPVCRDEPLLAHTHGQTCHVCGGYRADSNVPTCHACDRARPRCDTCEYWETWSETVYGRCLRVIERRTSNVVPSIEEPMTVSVDCNGGGIALVTLASFACDAYERGDVSTREGDT